jgi:hypothetical protein
MLRTQTNPTSTATLPIHFAAPLLGICAGAVLRWPLALSLAIGAAVFCICLPQFITRMQRNSRTARYLRAVNIATGHLVYLVGLCVIWQAVGQAEIPHIGWILFSLVLLMISLAGWLLCICSTGTLEVSAGWLAFLASASAMAALHLIR